MRICIFGAGAIGGYLGMALAEAGCDVSLIARGSHLAAIRAHGLKLISADGERTREIPSTDDPGALPAQDVVIVALKAHQSAAAADAIAGLCGPATAVVPAVNGVPWWYFHGLDGPWRDRRIESVDPGGRQWDSIGPERVIGCVVYPACEVVEPGTIRLIDDGRFSLGEPSGEKTQRLEKLADAMRRGGLKAPVKPRIRDEIWLKLWGSLSFNPISALTGATLEAIVADPGTRSLARAMMVEAEAIATKLGVRFPIDVDRRIAGAGAVGAHKTSMLQDLERGRALEIDALVGAVQELGRLVGVPTPSIDAVLALVTLKASSAGCLPAS